MMANCIRTTELAFDIDGVVADTMEVFVRLARERFGLSNLSKNDLQHYDLRKCVQLDSTMVDELICLTLDDEHTEEIPPVPGAPDVLTELARYGPLRFVTARIWPESIVRWLHKTLPDVPPEYIQVVATGDPERKTEILKGLHIKYFVEDRLETCRILSHHGIQPLLFDQPWNRTGEATEFPRVESWTELRRFIIAPGSV